MKRIQNLLLGVLIMMGISSCQEQALELYDASPSIYFVDSENNQGLSVSFGYVSSLKGDSILNVEIRTTGKAVNYDRSFSLSLTASTTMREGIDYEFLLENLAIPANSLSVMLPIRIIRTPEMREEALELDMELMPNEYFSTELKPRQIGSGENQYLRYYTKRYIRVDDIAGAPWFWDPAQNPSASIYLGYLGDYSSVKFQIMIARYKLDVEQVTAVNYRPAVTSILAWGRGMQAYLNDMEAQGTPILEADGTPMKMGPYSQ